MVALSRLLLVLPAGTRVAEADADASHAPPSYRIMCLDLWASIRLRLRLRPALSFSSSHLRRLPNWCCLPVVTPARALPSR